MPFQPDRPFNALPDLPPAQEVETRAVLKACIDAHAVLAELRTAGHLIPNQAVLINSIPLLEAQASSEIENIVTTTDRLFRYANMAADRADPATKEALRYRTALFDGYKALGRRPLSVRTAIEVCTTIKNVDMEIRATPGTALMNDITGEVIYTPPAGADLLRDKLANWERYIHDAGDTDPLVRMAVAHYQFEAIHPFTDGNGRTGRVLNLLFLIDQGLLDIPALYLSRAIIARKKAYYRLLLKVTTEGVWEDWILFMLGAVTETARWTIDKIWAIKTLLEETADRLRAKAPKIYSRELAEIVFVQPYCRIGDLVAGGVAKRQAASAYLKAMTDMGLLEERTIGREKIFINPMLIALLADQKPSA